MTPLSNEVVSPPVEVISPNERLLTAIRRKDAADIVLNECETALHDGADPNCCTEDTNSALMWAAFCDYPDIVSLLLLQPSISIWHNNKLGQNVFTWAVIAGSIPTLRLLFDYIRCLSIPIDIASIFSHRCIQGLPLIHYAIRFRHKHIALYLYYKGSPLDLIDLGGRSPLHHACFIGSTPLSTWLLMQGQDITLQDCHGDTPMHLLLTNKHTTLARLLYKSYGAGRCYTIQNKMGRTCRDILQDLALEQKSHALLDIAETSAVERLQWIPTIRWWSYVWCQMGLPTIFEQFSRQYRLSQIYDPINDEFDNDGDGDDDDHHNDQHGRGGSSSGGGSGSLCEREEEDVDDEIIHADQHAAVQFDTALDFLQDQGVTATTTTTTTTAATAPTLALADSRSFSIHHPFKQSDFALSAPPDFPHTAIMTTTTFSSSPLPTVDDFCDAASTTNSSPSQQPTPVRPEHDTNGHHDNQTVTTTTLPSSVPNLWFFSSSSLPFTTTTLIRRAGLITSDWMTRFVRTCCRDVNGKHTNSFWAGRYLVWFFAICIVHMIVMIFPQQYAGNHALYVPFEGQTTALYDPSEEWLSVIFLFCRQVTFVASSVILCILWYICHYSDPGVIQPAPARELHHNHDHQHHAAAAATTAVAAATAAGGSNHNYSSIGVPHDAIASAALPNTYNLETHRFSGGSAAAACATNHHHSNRRGLELLTPDHQKLLLFSTAARHTAALAQLQHIQSLYFDAPYSGTGRVFSSPTALTHLPYISLRPHRSDHSPTTSYTHHNQSSSSSTTFLQDDELPDEQIQNGLPNHQLPLGFAICPSGDRNCVVPLPGSLSSRTGGYIDPQYMSVPSTAAGLQTFTTLHNSSSSSPRYTISSPLSLQLYSVPMMFDGQICYSGQQQPSQQSQSQQPSQSQQQNDPFANFAQNVIFTHQYIDFNVYNFPSMSITSQNMSSSSSSSPSFSPNAGTFANDDDDVALSITSPLSSYSLPESIVAPYPCPLGANQPHLFNETTPDIYQQSAFCDFPLLPSPFVSPHGLMTSVSSTVSTSLSLSSPYIPCTQPHLTDLSPIPSYAEDASLFYLSSLSSPSSSSSSSSSIPSSNYLINPSATFSFLFHRSSLRPVLAYMLRDFSLSCRHTPAWFRTALSFDPHPAFYTNPIATSWLADALARQQSNQVTIDSLPPVLFSPSVFLSPSASSSSSSSSSLVDIDLFARSTPSLFADYIHSSLAPSPPTHSSPLPPPTAPQRGFLPNLTAVLDQSVFSVMGASSLPPPCSSLLLTPGQTSPPLPTAFSALPSPASAPFLAASRFSHLLHNGIWTTPQAHPSHFASLPGDPFIQTSAAAQAAARVPASPFSTQDVIQTNSSPMLCLDCRVAMPVGSYHCKTCNRCCYWFDHHCPLIDNCVAGNNYRSFFFFTFLGVILSWWYVTQVLYWLIMTPFFPISGADAILNMQHGLTDKSITALALYVHASRQFWPAAFHPTHLAFAFIMVCHTAILGLCVTLLWGSHIGLICMNETSVSSMNLSVTKFGKVTKPIVKRTKTTFQHVGPTDEYQHPPLLDERTLQLGLSWWKHTGVIASWSAFLRGRMNLPLEFPVYGQMVPPEQLAAIQVVSQTAAQVPERDNVPALPLSSFFPATTSGNDSSTSSSAMSTSDDDSDDVDPINTPHPQRGQYSQLDTTSRHVDGNALLSSSSAPYPPPHVLPNSIDHAVHDDAPSPSSQQPPQAPDRRVYYTFDLLRLPHIVLPRNLERLRYFILRSIAYAQVDTFPQQLSTIPTTVHT